MAPAGLRATLTTPPAGGHACFLLVHQSNTLLDVHAFEIVIPPRAGHFSTLRPQGSAYLVKQIEKNPYLLDK